MRLLACLAAAALAPAAASAATISVTLSGTITFIDSQILSGPFAVDDAFSASFQIDSATPDTDALPTEGEYIGALSNLAYSFGSYSGTGAGENQLHMRDGSGFFADNFFVQSDPSGADVAGFPAFDVLVNLADPGLGVFSSDAIPTGLDPADFSIADASIGFLDGSSVYRVHATIETLTYTVPEAGAFALLGLAGLGLAAATRRDR